MQINKKMNFGIEMFIYIFNEEKIDMNKKYGIKCLYWVAETYLNLP